MYLGSRISVGLIFGCMAALSTAGCGSTDREVPTASGSNGYDNVTTTSEGNESSNPTPTTTTFSETATSSANIEVSETGFSVYEGFFGEMTATAGAVLKNTGDEVAEFFEVIFSFKDANGRPVGTDTATIYAVGPGSNGFASVSQVEVREKVKAIDVSVFLDDSFVRTAAVPVTVEGVVAVPGGGPVAVEVRGTAVNETQQVLKGFQVTCVLRNGENIVGGATGYLDTILPGGSIAWTALGPVQATSAECGASGSI